MKEKIDQIINQVKENNSVLIIDDYQDLSSVSLMVNSSNLSVELLDDLKKISKLKILYCLDFMDLERIGFKPNTSEGYIYRFNQNLPSVSAKNANRDSNKLNNLILYLNHFLFIFKNLIKYRFQFS